MIANFFQQYEIQIQQEETSQNDVVPEIEENEEEIENSSNFIPQNF